MADVFGCNTSASAGSRTAPGATEEEVVAKVVEHAYNRPNVKTPADQ